MKKNTKIKLWIGFTFLIGVGFIGFYFLKHNVISLLLGCSWVWIAISRLISFVKAKKDSK